jgi:hypothetical protein
MSFFESVRLERLIILSFDAFFICLIDERNITVGLIQLCYI